ncbi:hypothetical protein JCM10207_008888 [Rhodosporidiobolus poonsookiae]
MLGGWGGGLLGVGELGGGRGWAGEGGRSEHVLVSKKRRSASPSSTLSARQSRPGEAPRASSTRERSWGGALLDTLEGHHGHHHHSYAYQAPKRRPSSPSLHGHAVASRGARASPKPRTGGGGGGGRQSPDWLVPPRAPSPPLTLDAIRSTYNPFPLFHIRRALVAEVTLLVTPLLFALYRFKFHMLPSPIFPSIPALPTELLALFALSVPFLALFRRQDAAFHPPFTDQRGFRDPKTADDGVAAALTLPVLLAAAVWWDTYSRADGQGGGVGLEGLKPLVQVWEANGVHALPSPSASRASSSPAAGEADPLGPLAAARALFTARYELVLLTSLNAFVLLVHLGLSKTLLRIERLPRSNAKRFFGFMGLAGVVSALVGLGAGVWDWVAPAGLPLSPYECVATTFLQQSSFYIVSRLARRGFTLGELNTMTAAGNALCLEFWRLSRARWYYKRGRPLVPPTFRAPTPILAFQAVLIPGAFLIGFLLSPLLVLSRNIASRPSHRLKWPTERSRHRRLLALGILLGLLGIVFFFLGGWTSWQLSSSHSLWTPWSWALRFLYFGDSDGVDPWPSRVVGKGARREWWRSGRERGRGWRRLALVGWWATVISSAIGGWQTHLVRARRIRRVPQTRPKPPSPQSSFVLGSGVVSGGGGGAGGGGPGAGGGEPRSPTDGAGRFRKRFSLPLPLPGGGGAPAATGGAGDDLSPPLSAAATGQGPSSGVLRSSPIASTFAAAAAASVREQGAQVSAVGAEHARADKAVHASLNMRRKFFHALAVLMFVPGIAVDPAFTSLSFSLAFTLFTFAEYARFFAVYPLGAPLHIFFTEFVDAKDAGPVVVSHFYLLTGCAGGLWLEGKGINRFTGVLVLGIGDSMASIIGKLLGRHRWPGTPKTVEGTLALILSVVGSAWFFRLIGIVEHFSVPRYLLATTLAALLEAASAQNDNLVLPIYMWSVVALLDV